MIFVEKPNRLSGPVEDLLAAGQGFLSNFARDQIARNIQNVTLLTEYSKPVSYTGAQVADLLPGGEAGGGGIGQKGLLDRIKPTVVVRGNFGTKTFAPYGVADPKNYGKNIAMLVFGTIGVLAFFTATGYYLGFQKGNRAR